MSLQWHHYSEQSLHLNKQEMQHLKGLILVVIVFVLLILGVILAFTYCTWVSKSYSSLVLPLSQPQSLWKQSDDSDLDWVLKVWKNSYPITFFIWNMNLMYLQNASMYIPKCFVDVFNTDVKIYRTYWEGNAFQHQYHKQEIWESVRVVHNTYKYL